MRGGGKVTQGVLGLLSFPSGQEASGDHSQVNDRCHHLTRKGAWHAAAQSRSKQVSPEVQPKASWPALLPTPLSETPSIRQGLFRGAGLRVVCGGQRREDSPGQILLCASERMLRGDRGSQKSLRG